MLGYKFIQAVFASANANDEYAMLDHTLGKSQSNARCTTDHQHYLIGEGHFMAKSLGLEVFQIVSRLFNVEGGS